ncbi:MAG TPA: DUF2382 domain-containing protein [Thermomicrobiales bacterium]|jgi:uncharacterized protein (TIGR02271 family)|nr:DUF2382 domain-containing protein [Thermomicrobiales bacterium]
MTSGNQDWIVEPGTDVYGSDGEKVGSVDTIEGEYLVIRKGFFFPKDHYIPFTAIAGHTSDRIDLNVTADAAKSEEWSGTTGTATGESAAYTGSQTLGATDLDADTFATAPRGGEVVARDEAPIEHVNRGASHEHLEDTIAVPVVEEELAARTRGVERGQVHVETSVTERQETLEVPVTEERVRVERVHVNRDATSADLSRDGATIDVPVYGEEVDVEKRARVVEEVQISKEAVQETRTVSDTVRREDVEVVDDTDLGTTGTRRP